MIGGTCSESQAPGGARAGYEANTIAGGKFWSQNGGRVTAIGISTALPVAPGHGYLAIYDDSPQGPSNLRGPPERVTLTGGTVEANVPHSSLEHTDLDAGKYYWLMAVSDQLLAFERCSGGTTWAQGAFTFGTPPAVLTTQTTTSISLVAEDTSPSIFIRIAHPQ